MSTFLRSLVLCLLLASVSVGDGRTFGSIAAGERVTADTALQVAGNDDAAAEQVVETDETSGESDEALIDFRFASLGECGAKLLVLHGLPRAQRALGHAPRPPNSI